MTKKIGISSLGLSFPPLVMSVKELAKLRSVDPDKYTIGLGCEHMALCPKDYGVVNLAVAAAERALSRWQGDISQIGLLAIGTESALDMSRPMSAWVAERLGINGAVRSYEIKHACYGGTVALRQAVEWKLSGAKQHALVIAADIALYAENDPGEPTQGAGAVAMIVDDQALIAEVDQLSYPWSKPAFDFWRPVGCDYPKVDSKFSLDCYISATQHCFEALMDKQDPTTVLENFKALCFHVPFPKMVKKAVAHYCQSIGWDETEIERFFNLKVDPTMDWNRLCGNAYTASLWIAVAKTLAGLKANERITAFSYGSGFGAELLSLRAGQLAAEGAWASDIAEDLKHRKSINASDYSQMRKETVHKS